MAPGFDKAVLLALNGLAGHSGLVGALAAALAQYAVVVYPLVMLGAWFALPPAHEATRRGMLYAVVAAALALAVSGILGHLLYRPRPFVADPGQVRLLIPHGKDSSFPSDHAAVSFAIAAATAWGSGGLGAAFYALAVLIALARVAVGAHWPTDVLAGAVLGYLSARAVVAARGALEQPVRWALRLFGFGAEGRRGL